MCAVGKVGNRAERVFAVITRAGVQQHVTARHTLLHLDDFFTFDVQRFGHRTDLVFAQCVAVRCHVSIILEALLHGTQIEKQLALGFGGRHLNHAPVFQNVLVHLGLDPVQGIAYQPHALVRVKAFDRFHQANVSLLNQVAMRQAIAQVLARCGHHQPQVG